MDGTWITWGHDISETWMQAGCLAQSFQARNLRCAILTWGWRLIQSPSKTGHFIHFELGCPPIFGPSKLFAEQQKHPRFGVAGEPATCPGSAAGWCKLGRDEWPNMGPMKHIISDEILRVIDFKAKADLNAIWVAEQPPLKAEEQLRRGHPQRRRPTSGPGMQQINLKCCRRGFRPRSFAANNDVLKSCLGKSSSWMLTPGLLRTRKAAAQNVPGSTTAGRRWLDGLVNHEWVSNNHVEIHSIDVHISYIIWQYNYVHTSEIGVHKDFNQEGSRRKSRDFFRKQNV